MNYKGLSKVADAFQAKAKGTNGAFAEVSDEPRMSSVASPRRICELGVEDFYNMSEDWDMFCMEVLGEGGPTGDVAMVWLDKKFMGQWNEFVEQVNLMNKIIQTNGSKEAYDAYDAYLDSLYNE